MTDSSIAELLLEDKKHAQDVIKYLIPLQSGPGADIMYSYAETLKATRLLDMVNCTEAALQEKGLSHDRLSGEIAGIILMRDAIDRLVAHAQSVTNEGNENE